MGDQLPAEGYIADVDGRCHFGHVPVHVKHAVGVAKVEVSVEDSDEDLVFPFLVLVQGGRVARSPYVETPKAQHAAQHNLPFHRDPALDHNGDGDAQQHQVGRDVEGRCKDHVLVVRRTLT